ncbi:uncharacterized protein LOC117646141 [Thrips palmi]|uniref:Uncharacterized protein LOC117646141 n=1 Tax=Thrips palmi TaxID=161013 RepID=A0A6P8ZNQ5_THRPL|nr:uncharacterized protein LOC117646141 [Thrips palmi]XP_034242764.1 uncharacterized protein LOC117646141 [Thrips palmi]
MSPKQHARCRVIGCNNQKTNPPPKTGMFLVPSSAPREVFEKWVQLTGNEELCEIPIDHLKRNLRICERHFLPNQVSPPTSKIKRLLQRGIASVVPTQFLTTTFPLPVEELTSGDKASIIGGHSRIMHQSPLILVTSPRLQTSHRMKFRQECKELMSGKKVVRHPLRSGCLTTW